MVGFRQTPGSCKTERSLNFDEKRVAMWKATTCRFDHDQSTMLSYRGCAVNGNNLNYREERSLILRSECARSGDPRLHKVMVISSFAPFFRRQIAGSLQRKCFCISIICTRLNLIPHCSRLPPPRFAHGKSSNTTSRRYLHFSPFSDQPTCLLYPLSSLD